MILHRPYDSNSHERRAVVDAIVLLNWLNYTQPRWKYGRALDDTLKLLADRLRDLIPAPTSASIVKEIEDAGVDLGARGPIPGIWSPH